MKIAVINFSGNVGKSTIAQTLLAPRMNNAQIISVESINSDGTNNETIRGKQFGDLMEALTLLDDAIVDIGASNVEDFINRMKQYHGSHEDFDYYIVPTVPNTKQQRDTISTIEALSELGIPAKKIRLVFNMVELDEMPDRLFSGLFDYHSAQKNFMLIPEATIHVNEIYTRLRTAGQNIIDILQLPTPDELKKQLKETTDADEKIRISQLIGTKRLAVGVVSEMDSVFKALQLK